MDLENDPDQDQNRVVHLRNRYEEIINQRAMKELTARHDAFKVDRERPSAFFLNLEKQVKEENYIPKLREGDRWIINVPS